MSIPYEVRLGYDALEPYIILWDLIRGPFRGVTPDLEGVFDQAYSDRPEQ